MPHRFRRRAFLRRHAPAGPAAVFQADVDAEAVYVDRLWTGKPTDESSRDDVLALAEPSTLFELGQLLAQPPCFEQLF